MHICNHCNFCGPKHFSVFFLRKGFGIHSSFWSVIISERMYLKAQRKGQSYSFSPTNEWCLPTPSVTKLEEREFVVDSGVSMHMLSRKDLNSAELETVRVSKSPTTVVTANGEVQTKEEATVYVKIGFSRESKASRRYTGSCLTLRILRRSLIFLRVDQWSESTDRCP